MANMMKIPKMQVPSAANVVEHGLVVGIILVLLNAAFTLETLEVMTGMIGAIAVYMMKENSSKRRTCGAKTVANPVHKCQDSSPGSLSGCEAATPVPMIEPVMQGGLADEMPHHDEEFVDLKAYVQAELNAFRTECKLESWKGKAEQAEAELAQLHDKMVTLEHGLSQTYSSSLCEGSPQTQTEALLMELAEVKLRAEEVEMELVQAHANMAELENDVARSASTQSRADESRSDASGSTDDECYLW